MKIHRILAVTTIASLFTASILAQPATTTSTNPSTTAQQPEMSSTTTSPQTNTTTTSFTSDQVKAIQQIVHDYLVSNPQVLVEVSQALQQQSAQKEQQFAMGAIKENVQTLFNDSASPVAGNSTGDVTLVEFFDYQCGHCKAMNPIVQTIIKNNPNLRIVFKELPIFGGDSQFAAKAALASVSQGKYEAFHDALLAADNPLPNDKVWQVAKSVGLNIDKLKKDMNSPDIQAQLTNNFKLAQALHLVGTPTFVLGNKGLTDFRFIPGATSQQNLQALVTQLAK